MASLPVLAIGPEIRTQPNNQQEINMFELKFSLDSAAFGDNRASEIARILRNLADTIEDLVRHDALGTYSGGTRDINGNTIGKWSVYRD